MTGLHIWVWQTTLLHTKHHNIFWKPSPLLQDLDPPMSGLFSTSEILQFKDFSALYKNMDALAKCNFSTWEAHFESGLFQL